MLSFIISSSALHEAKHPSIDDVFNCFSHKCSRLDAKSSVLAGLLQLGELLDGGSLSAPVKEQIALRVGNRNGCDYCQSAHTAIGKMVGLSEAQTIAARQGEANDDKAQAILALTDAILEREGFVTDDQLDIARESGLTDAEVLEVTGQVIKNFFTNFVNHIAQTEVDFPAIPQLQEA